MLLAFALPFFVQLTAGNPDAVETRLRSVLQAVKGVKFSHSGDTLVVRFQTHVVKIPQPSKLRNQQGLREIPSEQPKLTGFKLETYEFPHAHGEAARPQQAARMNPNWLRDYGSYKLDNVERQVDGKELGRYYYIEWGNKLNPTLLSKIRQALEQGTHPMKR